ncbi:MAG: hypothetical protein L7V85_03185 [Bacteroidia bacterium]|nr:hypothetical protein [Bacteroidia bacterium]
MIFNAQKSHATHMMGADITYRCIDTLKFEITLKWYRDCRGISLTSAGGLNIRCTSGGSRTATLTLVISPQNGSASMFSSTGGIISRRMMNKILTLKIGDFILIERLDGMDPYDQTRKRYPSVNFKLK